MSDSVFGTVFGNLSDDLKFWLNGAKVVPDAVPAAPLTPSPSVVIAPAPSSGAIDWTLGSVLYSSVFGMPTPTQIAQIGDNAAAGVAKAGGSIAAQQAAKAEAMGQVQAGADNFNKNNPNSNILQRAENAAVGTGNASDIVPDSFVDSLPDFLFNGDGTWNLVSVGALLVVLLVVVVVIAKL